jgi:anaerobic magnesium-protoporphyrin IX monomethyl ester cyclase
VRTKGEGLAGRYKAMKILLINPPVRVTAKPNCIPYGLATIASVLRKHGFHVDVYDINGFRHGRHEVVKQLEKRSWDVVGVSGLITTYAYQKWLIRVLKSMAPQKIVVSGGGLATSNRSLLLQNTAVDYTVAGEGEEAMLELCQALEQGGNVPEIAGVVGRDNGSQNSAKSSRRIENLDDVPFPAWDLIPMDVYLENPIWGDVADNSSGFRDDVTVKRSMNIISSRGCPYSCNYCYHLFGRSNYRFRSVQNVVDEIEALLNGYGVDFIGFVDDNMMASERRLVEFCDILESRRFPITWGCHGRVTSAKPEILDRMAEVGCVWIGYGIESGSQKILDAMNKKATVEQAKKAITNTRAARVYPNTTFIFGYPGETLETIQETVNFKREMGLECGSFFATPYPGTPLYQQIRHRIDDEEAFIESLGDATKFSINLTEFPEQEMFRLKEAMDSNEDVI